VGIVEPPITKELEIVYQMIKDLGFLAMAEEFKHEPGKREQIIRAMTKVIRKEQGDEKANRFYGLANSALKKP
jgi:hypothetical protein